MKLDFYWKTLETKEVVKSLTQRIDAFTQLEHIDQLQNYFLPKIERFGEQVDQFERENKDIMACIRKFD